MKRLLTASSLLIVLAVHSPASAEDLDFLLYNDSSVALTEFNLSPASSNNWGESLLEGDYLAPGYEIDVLIADGLSTCVYDIRGGFSDGSEAVDYNQNLCDLGEYTFSD